MRRLTWIAASLMLATSVSADEESNIGSGSNPEAASSRPRKARIGPGMAIPDMMAVRGSFKAAVKRLDSSTSCGALFLDLNLNGLQALSRGIYQEPQTPRERALCGGSAAAITGVGLGQVLICERFRSLPLRTRAAVLLHEALHTAGLNEAPHDPRAMTSTEITEMVKQACSL